MNVLRINKPDRLLKGTIRLPSSKSISNRLLIIRALSEKKFSIENISDSGDTVMLNRLLEQISMQKDPLKLTEIDAGDAGSVMRFLVAYLTMIPGRWVLTGTSRMKQRPIGILVDGLKPLGADIEFLGKLGFPPVLIKGKELKGREIVVDPGISSQFISALIMIGPALPGGLKMHLAGHPVSQPYIEMTLKLLEYFGINVKNDRSRLQIPQAPYQPDDFKVEADWSSAAFWYEAAALSEEADLVLEGLTQQSIQGDSVIAEIFENLGVHTEFLAEGIRLTKKKLAIRSFDYNFNDHPDIAPSVITTCAVLGIRSNFEGLNTLRIKESDRVAAMYAELKKIGINLSCHQDDSSTSMELSPSVPDPPDNLVFHTYGDHRMAMTFAPLTLLFGETMIENPGVVVKSYPGFWNDMTHAGFVIS